MIDLEEPLPPGMAEFFENIGTALYEPRYRMKWRWGFWHVQEYDLASTWDGSGPWNSIKWYPRKAEATAHLVRLALEGKKVEL